MSIQTLPLLIKNIHRSSQTSNVVNLLNRYNGRDWMEYINYSKYYSFCLYKNYDMSLHLIGISKQSIFSLENNQIHHIKILDGRLKVLPIYESIGVNVETFHFENKQQQHWLENNFVDHSHALLLSQNIIL
jgi:hypothetical protein